jgi:seryl-tRNA synthetase
MKRSQSSSTSQKMTSATPFTAITDTETQEAKRVKQELDAMQREQEEVEKAIAEKEMQAEDALRKEAREDLQEYKDTELSHILSAAEAQAEQECARLAGHSAKHAEEQVKELVAAMARPDSSLFPAV